MIKTKNDYNYYLEADKRALRINHRRPRLVLDEIWKFERLLRKLEYYENCKNSIFWKPYYYFLYFRFHRAQIKMGFNIYPNSFGPGLSISHPGTIIVNPAARIGSNCRIHDCVVIGTNARDNNQVPTIGNNIYIGPGAKIFGKIYIADGIAIGANSVVNKSFYEKNISIAGVPARKISQKGSKGIIIEETSLINEK